MTGERVWSALAGALAVAAVAATLNTLLSAPRHREIAARKQDDLSRIRDLAGRWAKEDALRARWDGQKAWAPADLNEVAIRTLGADVAQISPRSATPAGDGWQRREASVEIREAAYAEVALFLASASEKPPAWRLREIEIRPSTEAGKGGATLVLEALEKKQP